MERKQILWYALDTIFLAVFLIFFFTLSGVTNKASVWISFASILVAYGLLLFTPYFVRKGSASTDYRRPLFVASLAYFNVVFVFGVFIMILKPEHHTGVLLTNVALLGIYGIFLLINLLANEHTADQEAQREIELKYVKEAPLRLKTLAEEVKDQSLSKKLLDAYELISTSPAKSSPVVKSMEDNIMQEISDLESMDSSTESVAMMQSVEMIISLANKRNTKLQIENGN